MDGSSSAAVTSAVSSAPAAPASPTPAPPAKAAPVTAPSSGDLSVAEQPAAKPALPWGEGPLKFKAKFNGAEEDAELNSMEDLQRVYQQARLVGEIGKQRKVAEAKAQEATQRAEAMLAQMKADPFGFMRQQGLDPDAHVRNLIMERARLEKMSPEERLSYEKQQAEAPLKQQLERAQRQLQQVEQQRQEAALASWAEKEATERHIPAFVAGLDARNVPPEERDEDLMAEIGAEASTWLDAGIKQLDHQAIVDNVLAAREKSLWGRMGKQQAKVVWAKLSPQMRQELMAIGVAEWKAARNPAAKPGQQVEPPKPLQPKKREYISEEEFRKAIR